MPTLAEFVTTFSEAPGKMTPLPYLFPGVLPAKTEAILTNIITNPASPVDRTVQGMECLYAGLKVTSSFDDQFALVLGNLAYQVIAYSFHGKGDRATGIYGFCLRVLGEGSQPPEDDPEPMEMYLPDPEPEEEE